MPTSCKIVVWGSTGIFFLIFMAAGIDLMRVSFLVLKLLGAVFIILGSLGFYTLFKSMR